MPLTTRSRLSMYRGTPPEFGLITVDHGTGQPGGSLTVTLPESTGLSHWRVVFRRVGVEGDPGHLIDNIDPEVDTVIYTYLETDVDIEIEPHVYAIPSNPAYPERFFVLESKLVEPEEVGSEITWPADWDEADIEWNQRLFDSNVAKGSAVIQTTAPANPAGFEATLYHAKAPIVGASPLLSVDTQWVRTLTELSLNPGDLGTSEITWNPNSGVAHGEWDGLSVGWKHTASGSHKPFAWTKYYQGTRPAVEVPGGTGGTANQTLGSPTQAALNAAIDARIASGSSAEWIIDLPDGDYGHWVIGGKNLPGKTILRSQNQTTLGAKFSGAQLTSCRNLEFRFVDINRQGHGFTTNVVLVYSSHDITFRYCRIYAPEITRDSLNIGYIERARYGIRIDNSAAGGCTNITIDTCLFDAVMGEQLYVNGCVGLTISNNVSANACGDFLMLGSVSNGVIANNWGPRLHWPSWDPAARSGQGDFYHSDFLQMYSPNMLSNNVVFDGNVHIIAKHPTLPTVTRQGILIQGHTSNFEFRKQFFVTNAVQGIWSDGPYPHTNHVLYNNAVLRIIDIPSAHKSTYLKIGGTGQVFSGNIHQHVSGWPGVRNITGGGEDYTASLAYYVNPRAEISGAMSSYFDMRPVDGALTDWDYAGTPEGPYERFEDVIVNGLYPKIGPAAVAWKYWFDPKNQITS